MLNFLLVLLGIFAVILVVIWCVYCAFGPTYEKCPKCGHRVRVSDDGWFAYECTNCGDYGKFSPPF